MTAPTRSAFLAGVGEIIAGAGLGVWSPGTVITDPDRAITVQDVPQEPNQIIALTIYGAMDAVYLNDTTLMLQIRLRGDGNPSTVTDLDDALLALLHGIHDTTIGGIAVGLMRRVSSLPGPQDDNRRWQLTSNWAITVAWPTPYRPD